MAHHTGESLYKCPFCPRTFNSNANMYSHKKKQHSALKATADNQPVDSKASMTFL